MGDSAHHHDLAGPVLERWILFLACFPRQIHSHETVGRSSLPAPTGQQTWHARRQPNPLAGGGGRKRHATSTSGSPPTVPAGGKGRHSSILIRCHVTGPHGNPAGHSPGATPAAGSRPGGPPFRREAPRVREIPRQSTSEEQRFRAVTRNAQIQLVITFRVWCTSRSITPASMNYHPSPGVKTP